MLDKRPGILVATSARGRKALLTERKIGDGMRQERLVFSLHRNSMRKSMWRYTSIITYFAWSSDHLPSFRHLSPDILLLLVDVSR